MSLRYLLHLSLLSIILLLLFLLFNYQVPNFMIGIKEFGAMLLFFFFATAIQHYILVRSDSVSAAHFIRIFMFSTTMKLLSFLLLLVTYLLLFKNSAMHFTLVFAGLYFAFTGFEVVKLSSHFKK